MIKIRRFIPAALALGLAVAPLQAQGARQQDPRRDSLEARVRERMAMMLRTQVGLNDEQIRRLQATNRRFEGQRRQMLEQERRVRMELRAALTADTASEARVAALLDQTIQLQRQRLDLLEAEQKELATFLTPSQRARLYGMEEQMRQRMNQMRDSRPNSNPPARRPQGSARPGTQRPLT